MAKVRVELTNEAHDLIRAAAPKSYMETGIQWADGIWCDWWEQSTVARITEHALPGESFSDTIVRIVRDMLGMKSN